LHKSDLRGILRNREQKNFKLKGLSPLAGDAVRPVNRRTILLELPSPI
jgi:hypothetical protein